MLRFDVLYAWPIHAIVLITRRSVVEWSDFGSHRLCCRRLFVSVAIVFSLVGSLLLALVLVVASTPAACYMKLVLQRKPRHSPATSARPRV